jgi:hypothetical protein
VIRASVVAIVSVAGCSIPTAFTCTDAAQCTRDGTPGVCEPSGYCSFATSFDDCPSGRRYDDSAGPNAGKCVGAESCDLAWTSKYFDPCTLPAPLGDVHLVASGSPYVWIDTGLLTTDGIQIPVATGVLDQPDGPATIAAVGTFTIDATTQLFVLTSRPLVLAASGDIQIAGLVNASSAATYLGAGANPAVCRPAIAGGDGIPSGGSGGGGGGGFQGAGGTGGTGDTMLVSGGTGAEATAVPADVRGGCSGAPSGKAGPAAMAPSTPDAIGVGGGGGGGVLLASATRITLTGLAVAGGGGGQAGPQGAADGGGGGGSGGFVGFEAPQVVILGTVTANGGGGASGSAYATVGMNGQEGANATTTAAAGGASAGCGQAGGAGSFGTALTGTAVTGSDSCGGGGGGGGAGFIVIHAASYELTPVVASPPVTLL